MRKEAAVALIVTVREGQEALKLYEEIKPPIAREAFVEFWCRLYLSGEERLMDSYRANPTLLRAAFGRC